MVFAEAVAGEETDLVADIVGAATTDGVRMAAAQFGMLEVECSAREMELVPAAPTWPQQQKRL